MIVTLFNAVSAMAALTAAGLWWRSTVIAVPFDHEIPEDGWRPAVILASGPKGDIDVFKTQDAANALNNRAAKAALSRPLVREPQTRFQFSKTCFMHWFSVGACDAAQYSTWKSLSECHETSSPRS